MQVKIVDKKNGTSRSSDTENLTLDGHSIVFLKLAPESVTRYERRGNDLVLMLKDGKEVVVHDFYVQHQDTEHTERAAITDVATGEAPAAGNDRNDLVLIDDNGVAWWGQYTSPWSEFHFTEIEWDGGALIPWWPWLLGALGVAGLAALAADGDHGHRNGVPVANDDTAAGSEDGGPVIGNVLTNDTDADGDTLQVTRFTVNGTTYNAGETATIAGVGTLVINGNGSYTFTPAENFNGNVPVATYTIDDGKGGTDTAELRITITAVPDLTAADDTATTDEDTPVSGTVAGNDSTTSSGELTYTLAGNPGHGSVTLNPDGTYTYTPDTNFNGIDTFTYNGDRPGLG